MFQSELFKKQNRLDTLKEELGDKPSQYQHDIFEWVANGSGNALVSAVPGSGKTTTLVWASRLVDNGLFLAFNAHIAKELKRKLSGFECRTIHSLGYSVLNSGTNRLDTVGYKYNQIVQEKLRAVLRLTGWYRHYYRNANNGRIYPTPEGKLLQREVMKIFNLVRLTRSQDIEELAYFYGISLQEIYETVTPDGLGNIIRQSLATGRSQYEATGKIDFTDMITLPLDMGFTLPQFPFIFIDEAQDLNQAQTDFIMGISSGRVLAVGDELQSIYGFAGSNTDSMKNLATSLDAKMLPLSISYRCPSSHVNLAKIYNPDIEAAETAIEGEINYPPRLNPQPGDLIISRKTAPVVGACLKLLTAGRAARIVGRDVSKSLLDTLDRVELQPGYSQVEFIYYLQQYREKMLHSLLQEEYSQSKVERLEDEVLALQALYLFDRDVRQVITDIFAEANDINTIWLSTVHRAKGKEANNVWIIDFDDMPMSWKGQKDWEAQQEMNIVYIALTRAKQTLNILYKDEKQEIK